MSPRSPLTPFAGWCTRHESGIFVFAGGALGTALRAVLAEALPTPAGGLPVATLTVNLVGAFVLGWLIIAVTRLFDDPDLARRIRLGVGTGACGGFTTFSTFMVESVRLGEGGSVAIDAVYLAVSLAGGLAAAFGGIALAHAWPRAGVGR